MSNSTESRKKSGNNNQVLETKLPQKDTLAEQLDLETDCPRCGDAMELFSKFDNLSYHCDSCRLELDIY